VAGSCEDGGEPLGSAQRSQLTDADNLSKSGSFSLADVIAYLKQST
jgi:hypothetical protein